MMLPGMECYCNSGIAATGSRPFPDTAVKKKKNLNYWNFKIIQGNGFQLNFTCILQIW